MTQKNIIDVIQKEYASNVQKKDVEAIIKGYQNLLKKELVAGNDVQLPGVGVLKVKDIPERKGRDVRHGTPIMIPAHKAVRFSQSSVVKNELNPSK